MIVGHSDEIGLIINYINADGFIYVRPVGGVDPTILASHRAKVITKKGINIIAESANYEGYYTYQPGGFMKLWLRWHHLLRGWKKKE